MTRDLALEKVWKERFEEHKKSGMSIKAWCIANGFKTTTFHYWIKRFNTLEQKAAPAKIGRAHV